MKYNVKMSCGHEETVEIFGKSSDREKRIKYLSEYGMCKKCYTELQNKENSKNCTEVTMLYSEYKKKYPKCKTKIGSYSSGEKTITVYVPVEKEQDGGSEKVSSAVSEYIEYLCKILKIEPPDISFNTCHFSSKTMMAQCDLEAGIMYLRRKDQPDPDYLFAIAHELRHLWQSKTDKDLYFSGYKQVQDCGSVEEYNLQLAEVDAHAFAAVIMVELFGLQPQWNGLTAKVVSAIDNRTRFILKTVSLQ